MPSRFIVSIVLSIVLAVVSTGHGLAEQPSVRFDLALPHLFPSFAAIPFVFEDSDLDCPEDRTAIKVSNGVLTTHHFSLPPLEQLVFPTKYVSNPIDDATYRLQITVRDCRVDIDIRQQVRVDGEWKTLLVMEERRPSLSEEARKEAVRRRLPDFHKLTDTKKENQSEANSGTGTKQLTLAELNAMLRGKGPRRWAASTLGNGFPFDDAPKSCMDVFGEYQISKSRFAMAFFAPLPGELNKFVLEGSDLDPSHGRISLTKDDCRFEFTVSQSVMRDGQWIALPLRPVPDDKTAKPADSGP
jgi:hypothetical protein